MDQEAIQITIRATTITMTAIKSLIQTMIENRNTLKHGEQSLQKLNLQRKQLESIDIPDVDVRNFKRQLKKYAIDFSIMKNKPQNEYTIFFKSQDINRIYKGLEDCIKDVSIEKNKGQINKKIEKAIEKAAKQTTIKAEIDDRGHIER